MASEFWSIYTLLLQDNRTSGEQSASDHIDLHHHPPLRMTYSSGEPGGELSRAEAIRRNDEALLAQLGYKQEFKRAFTPLEVRHPLGSLVLVVHRMNAIFRIPAISGLWDSLLDHRFTSLDCIRTLLCVAERGWPSLGVGSKPFIQSRSHVFVAY